MAAVNIRRVKQEALLHKPVNGTLTNIRVLGGNSAGSAVVADNKGVAINTTHTNHMLGQQQQQQEQQPPTKQEARQAFLTTQEAKMEAVRCHREQEKLREGLLIIGEMMVLLQQLLLLLSMSRSSSFCTKWH